MEVHSTECIEDSNVPFEAIKWLTSWFNSDLCLKVTLLFKNSFGLLWTEFWSEYLNIAHEAPLYLGLKGCIEGIAKKLV